MHEAELLAALRERPECGLARGARVRGACALREEGESGEHGDSGWRAITSRARIACEEEGCLGTWDRLAPTSMARVRACSVCERCSVYCVRAEEAGAAGRQGHPAVLDVVERARTMRRHARWGSSSAG